MTKKLLLVAGSLMLFLGTTALQGCFDSGHGYGYGHGYSSGPASYSEPGYYSGPEYYNQPGWIAHEQDMNNDARAVREAQTNVRHDRQELYDDLKNGDYDAAAHEQTEIQQRRANIQARKADLNADQLNRYYSDDDAYGRR